jgi:hypothetical protein
MKQMGKWLLFLNTKANIQAKKEVSKLKTVVKIGYKLLFTMMCSFVYSAMIYNLNLFRFSKKWAIVMYTMYK